jgi:hypothetical protein
MNALLMNLLERTLAALLMRLAELDLNTVKNEVLAFWNASLTGEEKRRLVFIRLREMSKAGASWLLYAAIEIAVGRIKREQGE